MKKPVEPQDDVLATDDLDAFDELEGGETLITTPPLATSAVAPSVPIPSPKVGIDALDLAPDVPVQVVAVMAKKTISMKELLELQMGEVVELNRPASEHVDLVANGKLIARGELVEIDGKLGVRIFKLVR